MWLVKTLMWKVTVCALIVICIYTSECKSRVFEWLFLFSVFKVENSENLLQVQTVFYPAQKRGGKCVHIHTHTHTHTCAQLLLYTVRTFIEIMCLMQWLLCVVQPTYRNGIWKNTIFTEAFGNIVQYFF